MTPDSGDEALTPLELWKAQLAYVSGTILAWGAVLLQLWPVVARLQTGTHVLAIGRDPGHAGGTAVSFYLLAILVAVGLAMLGFGAAHVVARGAWLTRFLLPPAAGSARPATERVAVATYLVLHILWGTATVLVALVALSALSALVTALLATALSLSQPIARILAWLLVFGPALAVTGVVLARRARPLQSTTLSAVAARLGWRNIALAYGVLLSLWLLVIQFSYVASLRLPQHVFSRAAEPQIVATVELGGATSDPSPAELILSRSGGEDARPLRLRRVDEGRYVAIVATSSLTNGDYEIALSYPHGALSARAPFVASRIHRQVAFVVVD